MPDPIDFNSPGMLQADAQGPGLLKLREAYGRYVIDAQTRGEPVLTLDQWVAAQRNLQTHPAGAPAAPVARGGPTSEIADRLTAQQEAPLQAERARQEQLFREAQRKAREKRAIPARAGQVY